MVFPSPETATELPWSALPIEPVPTSFSWVHPPPERVNTQDAPIFPLSPGPPTMAVLPSLESETEKPCNTGLPIALEPTNLDCWLHAPRERANTHTAPVAWPSDGPPIAAVSP